MAPGSGLGKTFMIDRVFFDTNVLLYLYDHRFPEKRRVARTLVERFFGDRAASISTQVLQEFFVAATKKTRLLSVAQAAEEVALYSQLDGLLTIQPAHILEAIQIHIGDGLSFWDSLILAAARATAASVLYSEDLTHGRVYAGVRVENPFQD